MSFWQLFHHVVFAPHERRPMLKPELRLAANRLITQQAKDLRCVTYAVHGQPDHVHAALAIPPSLSVAAVIGQIKGSSSHALSTAYALNGAFAWQSEYGVLSLGQRQLPLVVRYVGDQDRRHAARDLWLPLERTSQGPDADARG